MLRSYLQRLLPDYMLPAAFVFLDALPLSPSGKVDRRALPAPGRSRPDLDRKFVAPRDDAEQQMAQIWEELLGTRPVGALDNFFELGGHSLLAVRLLSRIEKTFGKALPVATVFQAPTLEEVARIVREEKPSRATAISSIVEIQPRGSKPPLFLVHGAGGGMFWGYANLARCLGEDQPVYGFKSRGLDGLEEFDTIEDMAAHYIADLRARQPHGPYYLGGYCFGGNVAYEMAIVIASSPSTNILPITLSMNLIWLSFPSVCLTYPTTRRSTVVQCPSPQEGLSRASGVGASPETGGWTENAV